MTVFLRELTPHDEAEATELHRQILELDDFEFLLGDTADFTELIRSYHRQATGLNLPPGKVKADFLVAEDNGHIVGRSSIRYELTPQLLAVGGHIGYAVAPAFRGKGYAGEILRQSLERLRAQGLTRALVTCSEDNTASRRTIEKAGGKLENTVTTPAGPLKRRYWIDLL